jgi:3-oxoacyl-[acyl-carrier protein] reductase
MELSLTGFNALVCGSSQGIGKAIAIQLALSGANVCVIARNRSKLAEVLSLLDTSKGQTHFQAEADFSHPDSLKTALQQILEKYSHFNILINNTGGPAAGSILGASPNALMEAFTQHVICNQLLTESLVDGMKSTGYGRIINIISTSVKIPIPGLGVSNTIRGAVANWAKTLAGELGPFGITVNNILPGLISTSRLESLIAGKMKSGDRTRGDVETQMLSEIPAGRFGNPEDIAAAVSFLCSPSAAYINGVNLPVDGGKTGSL